MKGLPNWTTRAASPRGLLSLALVLGTLSGYAGRGTLAFFTSSVVSQANAFSGGIVDIAGDFTATGSTASVLTKTAFSWTSIGAHNNTTTNGANPDANQDCANILTGLDVRTQGMAPGNYCVAKIDLNNTNTNAIDAWMRIRVVRSTPASWNSDTQIASGSEALNDRLKLYMHEYSGATEGAPGNKLARDANCTTAGYKPTWTGPTATASAAGTAQFNSVPGTSSGKIRSLTSTSGTAGADERLSGTGYTSVSRVALTSLGETGKNLGAHPGISAVTVTSPTGARNSYGADQDQEVLNLVNKTNESVTETTTSGNNQTSANGLRLKAGTATASGNSQGPAPTEANMATVLASRNSFNLVGNDEVTNPVTMGLVAGTNNSFDPSSTSNSNLTPRNGSEPHGTNLEAELKKGQSRYYCAAIFFPSDTDTNFPTVYSDTTTGGLGEFYPTAYASGQYTDCWTGNPSALPAGCSSLGTGQAALTAANLQGDNAAKLGQTTYYLVVSAAQKAGRTTN